MNKSAIFSDDRRYRYVLTRHWGDGPVAMCIGLNPSNANEIKDDPTITRLIKTLECLEYGKLHMLNLYALVSSKPQALFDCHDPVKDNDQWLRSMRFESQTLIFAWGNFKGTEHRQKKVREMFDEAWCFGRNKNGTPWHPLAMMYAGIKVSEARLIRY